MKILDIGCIYEYDDMNMQQMRKAIQLFEVAVEAGYTHIRTFDESGTDNHEITKALSDTKTSLEARITKRGVIVKKWCEDNPDTLPIDIPDELFIGLE